MSFQKQVFISYTHFDNKPLLADQQGWISRFHATLEALLTMRLGEPAQIWRDIKLRGNDSFAEEITDKFKNAAIFVSVLSPRYLKSDWCVREAREFCEAARQDIGVTVEHTSRIFKVVKTPVETEDPLPPEMKDVLGYAFFVTDDGEAPLELDPLYGGDLAQAFMRKLATLAWHIAQTLKKLETRQASPSCAEASPQVSDGPKPSVYLAEVAYDQAEAREILQGELLVHGYRVVPDRPLPRDEVNYAAAVKTLLCQCQLAVHLVGRAHGGVPDGPSDKSCCIIQNDLAALQAKTGALRRVVWVPQGTHADNPIQQAFIAALHEAPENQIGTELLTGDLEQVKTTIHALLQQRQQPVAPPSGPTDDAVRRTYLVCTETDRKSCLPLLKFLRSQGLEVSLPVFGGDAEALRTAHETQVRCSDAVLLFYGDGDEAWRFFQQNDVRKIACSQGQKRPVVATYVAAPGTEDKEIMLATGEPNVIDGLAGMPEPLLEAFAHSIAAGET
jgi:hypothetical protein